MRVDERAVQGVVEGAVLIGHDAAHYAREANQDMHDLAANHYFKDFVNITQEVSKGLSIVAPFLLPIPVVGDIVGVAVVVTAAVAFAGEFTEMAYGDKPWDPLLLAGDAGGAVFRWIGPRW